MRIDITIEQALQRYPEQVADIIAKLRKNHSVNHNVPSINLKWGFDWVVSGKALTFNEMIEQAKTPPPKPTIEQELQDYAKSCHVRLMASIGHWQDFSDHIPTPPEIIELKRKGIEERNAKKALFNALPPEEQQNKINGLLSKLRKYNGFIKINI